jgi:hypothetical protein
MYYVKYHRGLDLYGCPDLRVKNIHGINYVTSKPGERDVSLKSITGILKHIDKSELKTLVLDSLNLSIAAFTRT